MKKVRLFKADWCPHCQRAKGWLDELLKENTAYKEVELEIIDIDNEKEKMVGVDFYYVPTFYVEDEKVFEGVPSKEAIKDVLETAM